MDPAKEFRQRRNELFPIGLVEHHLIRDRSLSKYDIAEKLISVQDAVDQVHSEIGFDSNSVLRISRLVTQALSQPDSEFARNDEWESLVDSIEEVGGFQEDPSHMTGWILSSLYWNHLTVCQFATAWLYTDAIRMQYSEPRLKLPLEDVGKYLGALSGAGPPVNDGQTFFPGEFGA